MLKSRLITAALLISAFLLALFFATGWSWGLFCLLFTVVGAFEWARLIKLDAVQTIFHILSVFILSGLVIYSFNSAYDLTLIESRRGLLMLSSMVWLLVVPAYLFFGKLLPESKLFRAFLGVIILVANLAAFLGLQAIAPLLLLAVIATVSIADSAAYFGGKRFGKHKLAPSVSPGKTWEGVISAILAVIVYAIVLNQHLNYSQWLLVGLVGLVVVSVMGDLFESKLKRLAGLKDSGTLLPGHGGVLDRIDGIMPAVTITYLYISLML